VRDWEERFLTFFTEQIQKKRRGKVGKIWKIDETYVRVKGEWCYLYQGIDENGNLMQPTRETVSEPRELEMPVQDERRWPDVRDYLVEARKLPAALVDRMHERGLVYADLMQNAVFVHYTVERQGSGWQRGEATGATLRGTWGDGNSFHGLDPGSDRESGWFWIGAGSGEISRVLLT
jgi:hypothetical protein